MAGIFAGFFGLAGAVVGGFLSGGAFAGILVGWGIGTLLAGILGGREVIDQGTIASHTQQTSDYGTPIPVVKGTDRVAGQLIWAWNGTGLFPKRVKEVVGGIDLIVIEFGGTEIRYTEYYGRFAILLCKGPIKGVAKIWINGRVWYNNTTGATEEERLQSLGNSSYFTLYTGTETQDPDPYIEDDIGTGAVSAFRGYAYIVFHPRGTFPGSTDKPGLDLPFLGIPNGPIPRMEFQVIGLSGTLTPRVWESIPHTSSSTFPARERASGVIQDGLMWVVGGLSSAADPVESTYSSFDGVTWDETSELNVQNIPKRDSAMLVSYLGELTLMGGYSFEDSKSLDDVWILSDSGRWNPAEGVIQGRTPLPLDSAAVCVWQNADLDDEGIVAIFLTGGDRVNSGFASGDGLKSWFWFTRNRVTWERISDDCGIKPRIDHTMLVYDQDLYVIGGHVPGGEGEDNGVYKLAYGADLGDRPSFTRLTADLTTTAGHPLPAGSIWGATVWNGRIIAFGNSSADSKTITYSSADGSTWDAWGVTRVSEAVAAVDADGAVQGFFIGGSHLDALTDGDFLFVDGSSNNDGRYTIVTGNSSYDAATNRTFIQTAENPTDAVADGTVHIVSEVNDFDAGGAQYAASVSYPVILTHRETMYMIGGTANGTSQDVIYRLQGDILSDGTIELDDLLSDIMTDSGLASTEIDVTAGTGTYVQGYTYNTRPNETSRDALTPLLRAFFLDPVLSDGKIKIVARGGSTAATIGEDDLLPAETSGQRLALEMSHELELPKRVTILYKDLDREYQRLPQSSARATDGITEINPTLEMSLEIPIALDKDKAAQIADVLLRDAWVSRISAKFATTWKYLYLDPGDVVSITIKSVTHSIRIQKMDITKSGVCLFDGVVEDTEIYNTAVTGTEPDVDVPSPPMLIVSDMIGLFMDIPILRASADDFGFYMGWAPSSSSTDLGDFRGGTLYRSGDGGESYETVFSAFGVNPTRYGKAADALPAPVTFADWDYANTVTVILNHADMELSSTTKEGIISGLGMSLSAKANLFLLGDEIIQAKTVTATGTSGRRYVLSDLRRGVFGTEWAADDHAVADRFIDLSSSIFRVSLTERDIGMEYLYKVVASGRDPGEVAAVRFTCNAVGKKPYSPVQLSGSRQANGTWKLTWIRRTRYPYNWVGEAPLAEATEAYDIEILDEAGTVLRGETPGDLRINAVSFGNETQPTYYYTRALQLEDFGGIQDSLTFRVYQISASVGRGYVAEATVTV